MKRLFLAVKLVSTMAVASIATAQTQIGGPDQAQFEELARAAASRSNFAEALRYQRLAVANIDRVEPRKMVYRSWVRYKLGALMIFARDCAAAIPVFRESARLVSDREPAEPDPYWKDNIIWASDGVAQAYICLNRPADAATELETIELRFSEAPYADCAKAMVKISGTLAYSSLGEIDRARSRLTQARSFLAKCDEPDRRTYFSSVLDRLASKLSPSSSE